MSLRLKSLRRGATQLTPPFAVFVATFVYLGLAPLTATLASSSWVLLGAAGAWLIEWLNVQVQPQHRLLVMLGPAPLLGLGLAVFIYLLVRGGPVGVLLVVSLTLVAAVRFATIADNDDSSTKRSAFVWLLVGAALLANSKEFPNLLLTGLVVLAVGHIFSAFRGLLWRAVGALGLAGALIYDLLSRPSYWWWSSDDTTTLSGIGTTIIERGRVADVAGWSTGAHHWLLHAWLALWNLLSFGRIFETYLIAWPLVAAVSMFASLWLFVEVVLGRTLSLISFATVVVVTAGLVRLDWSAPQEQQPFLFAMIATCALWLKGAQRTEPRRVWKQFVGVVLVVGVVPAMLYVLKPSLLVAYLLLLLGSALAHFGFGYGRRVLIATVASLVAVCLGLAALWFAGSWITSRSFTSFDVRWFPKDLGWCYEASKPGSLACVLSLQVVLFVAALLSAVVLVALRIGEKRSVSLVMLLPLVVTYLPLRYFITSGVGSGAPSFYRLSEMAMMMIIALAIGLICASGVVRPPNSVALLVTAAVVHLASRGPSGVYDWVDSLVVNVSFLRYLNPSDGIALVLVGAVAVFIARTRLIGGEVNGQLQKFALSSVFLVSLLPAARLVTDSVVSDIDPTRMSRPADFGPPDIDDVGEWLLHNTEPGTLLATNYLCPESRIDECTTPPTKAECPRTEPALMASWALAALSKREFYYLSQMWDTHSSFYLEHMTSTKVGNDFSSSAVKALEDSGVSYYVASREHTSPMVWPMLRDAADLRTEHFAVVSLRKLLGQ